MNRSVLNSARERSPPADLPFPKLVDEECNRTRTKRRNGGLQSNVALKKRRSSNTALEEGEKVEDHSWIDNFFLLEFTLPDQNDWLDPIAPFLEHSVPQEIATGCVPSVLPPLRSEQGDYTDAASENLHNNVRIPRSNGSHHPAKDDFSVQALQDCPDPTLLTLTSYPFRVVFTNAAYSELSGGKSVVGDSMFNSFAMEEISELSLCVASALIDKFQHEKSRVQVICQGHSSRIPCMIKVFPITDQNQPFNLRNYAVRFYRSF